MCLCVCVLFHPKNFPRLNYYLFGLKPIWFHFTNILMHSIVCILFTRVCIIVAGLRDNFAIIAGILFAVHPIHTEAVSILNLDIMSSHQINEEINRKEQHRVKRQNERTNKEQRNVQHTHTHTCKCEKSLEAQKKNRPHILVEIRMELSCTNTISVLEYLLAFCCCYCRHIHRESLQPAHTQYQLMDFEFRHYTNDLSSVCCG